MSVFLNVLPLAIKSIATFLQSKFLSAKSIHLNSSTRKVYNIKIDLPATYLIYSIIEIEAKRLWKQIEKGERVKKELNAHPNERIDT